MKLMRLAICVAAFAVVGGIAIAEDMDVRALQAKLAAQEARLNDLQAKMYSAGCEEGTVADGITTLRKNATITLGGTVNTRYFYRNGRLKSSLGDLGGDGNNIGTTGNVNKVADYRGGDLFLADAKLEGKIDVNDNFDAYFKFDLQSSDNGASDNAEQYWVRWKNINCTGFGVLAGRDGLKYGMGPSVGVLDSWSAGNGPNGTGDMFSSLFGDVYGAGSDSANAAGLSGMFAHGSSTPFHSGWDYSRVMQLTPYWENSDGSFRAEVSFIQDIYEDGNAWIRSNGNPGTNNVAKFRKSYNDGVGSMTGRITWKPIEGLSVIGSVMNQHNKYAKNTGNLVAATQEDMVWGQWGDKGAKNNIAASLGIEWTPGFLCNKLTLWGYYQHAWNEAWIKDMDSDLVNAGIMYNFTDQFYAFAQGDYMYIKNDQAGAGTAANNPIFNGDPFHKAKGWAGYLGVGYVLPYGANLEVGYKHEKIDYKNRQGNKHTKYKGDIIYAHLGFNF